MDPQPQTVPCPGCALPMGLDEEVCPHCRRPRDELEIERGKQDLADAALRERRRPYVLAARAAAGLALLGLFLARHLIAGRARAVLSRGSAEIERYRDPDYIAGRPPGTTKPAMAEEPPAPEPLPAPVRTPAAPAQPAFRPAPAAPAPPPAAPTKPAAPARRKAGPAPVPVPPGNVSWVFYGVVYDMATADAVAGAKVRVRRDGESWGVTALSDQNGVYRVYVPRNFGEEVFLVEATAPGYRAGQVEDREPPWRESPEKERLEAMSELTGHDLDPIPRRPKEGDGLLGVDILLLPAAKDAR